MTEPATIGHNEPPASEAFAMAINDLKAEASNFLDGEPIDDEKQAEAYSLILDSMKEYLRDAEKTRKSEKEPHLQAGREVDSRWKAVTDPAKLTIDMIAKPLTVWRQAVQAKRDAEAKVLRERAERDAQKALDARNKAQTIEQAEQAEAMLESAKIATATANKIDRSATGLRTTWDAQVLDYGALLKWMKAERPNDLMEFLNTYAQRNVQLAKAGQMPGVEAREIRKAA